MWCSKKQLQQELRSELSWRKGITWNLRMMVHIKPKISLGFPSTMSAAPIDSSRTCKTKNMSMKQEGYVTLQLPAHQSWRRKENRGKTQSFDSWAKSVFPFLFNSYSYENAFESLKNYYTLLPSAKRNPFYPYPYTLPTTNWFSMQYAHIFLAFFDPHPLSTLHA